MRYALSLAFSALLATGLIAALMTSGSRSGGATATADASAEMTADQRAAFHDEVRAYLLDNPEVIVEAMTVLQTREDRLAAENDRQLLAQNAAVIFESDADWSGGNPEGDITLVEFMDYRCGYCHKAYTEVEELVKSDGNIRFVLKEFPVLGEQSVLASKFAIAVRQLYGDEAYKAVHDALFALRGQPSPEVLAKLATDLGHDAAAISRQMADHSVQAVLDANYALAELLEINGTPTFILDGVMVRGYVPLDGMRQIVERERAG